MDDLERIEHRYGLRVPEAYRSMQASGWLDAKHSAAPDYFWLYEAEWMSPGEIADYLPAEIPQARLRAVRVHRGRSPLVLVAFRTPRGGRALSA